MIQRGDVWWADLDDPVGSSPGFRRPVVIIQSDAFNRSRIQTVVALVVTSNVRLVDAPGNVLLKARAVGLPKDAVANASHVVTLDRESLTERAGRVGGDTMMAIDRGLRLVLDV